MVTCRSRVVLAAVMCAGLTLAGCSTPSKTEATSSAVATNEAVEYDLARLGDIAKDLPAGFVPYPSEATEINPLFIDQVGAVVSYGKPFTVVPSQCHDVLKPVEGQSQARTNGVRADGPDKQSIAVNADDPVTVATGIPTTGCDRMTFDVEDEAVRARGTAERIAAPAVDGATTEALRIQYDGATVVQYFYSAILDDRLYVNVAARLNPGSSVQPQLSDLLIKAIAAIRDR